MSWLEETYDSAASKLGWRRATVADREYHGINSNVTHEQGALWVRSDGLRHGWVAASIATMDIPHFQRMLQDLNASLAETQRTHPYSFLPDDEIVPATVDGTKGRAWIAEHHGGESLAEVYRNAHQSVPGRVTMRLTTTTKDAE